jgi:hypothetical protein
MAQGDRPGPVRHPRTLEIHLSNASGWSSEDSVRFYDLRNDVPGDGALTTDSWFRHSHDRGRTWREARLGQPFDLRTAPEITGGIFARGFMLGEYEGLVGMRHSFATVFARARPAALAGPADIFFARIGLKRGHR